MDSKCVEENENLKEIIEVAKHISSFALDVKSIIKNVIYCLTPKFNPDFTAFILPRDFDDLRPSLFLYKGVKNINKSFSFESIKPLLHFFESQEFNQISFSDFCEQFNNKKIINEIKSINPEFIMPMKVESGAVGIYMQGKTLNKKKYSVEDIHFCSNIISFAAISIENATLFRQATVDRMTKLFSHHTFQERLKERILAFPKTKELFSLIMFDIDHFKNFNDSFGHLQGDKIIKEISSITLNLVRDFDVACRYGGEEFMIILPGVDIDSAVIIAERLRKSVEKHQVICEDKEHNVTISVGVVQFEPIFVKHNIDIIQAVDKALYFSKQNGRNKVSVGSYDSDPVIYGNKIGKY